MHGRAVLILAGLACGVTACAGVAPPARAPDLDALAAASLDDRCIGAFRLADHHAGVAGVRDAEAVRVPGHPYLRANRFLASFRDAPLNDAATQDWIGEMRRLDREGRTVELANLPPVHRDALKRGLARLDLADAGLVPALEACGAVLAQSLATATDDARADLRNRVNVPDSYSTARRIIGLYPLTAVGATTGFDAWKRDNLPVFDLDPEQLPTVGRLTRYAPPPVETAGADGASLVAGAPRNALGMAVFGPDALAQLARLHAPVFEIDVAGPHDMPGVPALSTDGGPVRPTVRTDMPVAYVRLAHTRFQGEILPQIVYTIWFAERPPDDGFDILSGYLDGVVWRVTLGRDGTPVVYDSMHPCGCYHLFFPVPPTVRKPMPEDDDAREEALAPAEAPQLARGERIVVRLASGSHYVQAVGKTDATAQAAETYDLVMPDPPDGPLRMLAAPDGAETRSLYDETGLVPGSERAERWLLWPMGIDSAGAMRQWGNHATAFVGRRHFDDPDLFDRAFAR